MPAANSILSPLVRKQNLMKAHQDKLKQETESNSDRSSTENSGWRDPELGSSVMSLPLSGLKRQREEVMSPELKEHWRCGEGASDTARRHGPEQDWARNAHLSPMVLYFFSSALLQALNQMLSNRKVQVTQSHAPAS